MIENHTEIYKKYGTALEIIGKHLEICVIHQKSMKIQEIYEGNIEIH